MLSGYAWYALSAVATSLHPAGWKRGSLSRILVIKTDHIGDFLLCLPAVRDYVAREPQAEVGFVVGTANVPLAERVPWIHEVHAFDSPRYARGGPPSPESQLREILDRDWDLLLDLTNDHTATIAALRRPVRHRRDVGTYRLRQKALSLVRGGDGLLDTHATDVFYGALGMEPPSPVAPEPLRLREEDRAAASDLIARGWPGEQRIVSVHAGATWEFRRWPAARFVHVVRELEARGLAVFFVGGPNDQAISAELTRAAGLKPERNLAGQGDLPTTAAVLERSAALLANDGGPMHLAAAQGTPVVGIFGPTSPERFGPLGRKSTALWRRRDCSPCEQRHCIWNRALCLEPIDTDQVLDAVLRAAGEPS